MPKKGQNTGGGTPKGVGKPHRVRGFQICGMIQRMDTYRDVNRACTRFIESRIATGEMKSYSMRQQVAESASERVAKKNKRKGAAR